LLFHNSVHSFGLNPTQQHKKHLLQNTRNSQESILRDEIANRNALVDNEEKYAVADGEFLEKTDTLIPDSTSDVILTDDITASMERLLKPRAYPLFLLEKAVELVESSFQSFDNNALEEDTSQTQIVKEKIVILGTGWGAASFIKNIDTKLYDVTVISPRNYFLFTPMLAGCSVGTVEYRSITESIREINNKAFYLEGTATEILPDEKKVTCEAVQCAGSACEINSFEVSYDKLVVSIGAQTNTFGIPGVREYCCFLKEVPDAQRIRTAIVNCFEQANLPEQSEEERKRKLSFAVIGAGPTGIEFAAELRDFVEEDGPKYYPHLLKYVRIKVIEASNTVLAPFDKSLQEEAIRQMNRAPEIKNNQVRNLIPERFKLTELLLESAVKEVNEKYIMLQDGIEVPYGLAVWAAGNGPIPLTLSLIESLGEKQANQQDTARGRVAVDSWMRAVGGEGKIMTLGDCSINTKNQLPATGQVAAQQGEYLASLLNKKYNFTSANDLPPVQHSEYSSSLSDLISNFATQNSKGYAKPFQFLNLGILAYTGGGSALAQVNAAPNTQPVKSSGRLGYALWRSVYLSKQASWRNRLLVLNDWIKRQIFGRDITRI